MPKTATIICETCEANGHYGLKNECQPCLDAVYFRQSRWSQKIALSKLSGMAAVPILHVSNIEQGKPVPDVHRERVS